MDSIKIKTSMEKKINKPDEKRKKEAHTTSKTAALHYKKCVQKKHIFKDHEQCGFLWGSSCHRYSTDTSSHDETFDCPPAPQTTFAAFRRSPFEVRVAPLHRGPRSHYTIVSANLGSRSHVLRSRSQSASCSPQGHTMQVGKYINTLGGVCLVKGRDHISVIQLWVRAVQLYSQRLTWGAPAPSDSVDGWLVGGVSLGLEVGGNGRLRVHVRHTTGVGCVCGRDVGGGVVRGRCIGWGIGSAVIRWRLHVGRDGHLLDAAAKTAHGEIRQDSLARRTNNNDFGYIYHVTQTHGKPANRTQFQWRKVN